MTSRERVLVALNRKKPDRVPVAKTWDYFCVDLREVQVNPSKKDTDFSKYLPSLPESLFVNEWGVGQVKGSIYHFTKKIHPLRHCRSSEGIEEYPRPDIAEEYRYRGLKEKVKEIHNMGYAVTTADDIESTIFERAWHLRGMDNLLMNFLSNADLATVLLDKITEISCVMAQKYVDCGIDILRLGDDIGSQKTMIMSPSLWRVWIKPRLKQVIDIARERSSHILISYHSDGFIEPVIPDLIEIGVDVLNPVQPECMDPVKLKKKYGNRLSFWGNIGTQTTKPFGTPGEVREVVKHMIETVGRGGDLLIAPTHVLEPNVSWENILAFVDAVNGYGYY